MTQAKHRQSGNVIFIILIAIALFAALSFAVSKSMSGGAQNLDKELVNVKTNEIIAYSNIISDAVQSLTLMNDCLDTELSFENSNWAHTDYDNAGAPEDCKIFSPLGGGVTWKSPDDKITTLEWEFLGDHRLAGAGDSTPSVAASSDLIMFLPDVSEQFCLAINKKVSLNTIPTDAGETIDATLNRFAGTFVNDDNLTGAAGAPHNCSNSDAVFCGKNSGCYKENSGNEYFIYFRLLHAR